MAGESIRVDGVEILDMKLRRMAASLSGPQLNAAMKAGAVLITNRAKQLAPYDTGTLRRSIHELVVRVGSQVIAYVGVPKLSEDGDDMGYSIYQEFGTSRMRAHPYLRPAFNETKDDAIREIADAVKELVDDNARL